MDGNSARGGESKEVRTIAWPLRRLLCGNGDWVGESRDFGIVKAKSKLTAAGDIFLVWIENPTEFVRNHV